MSEFVAISRTEDCPPGTARTVEVGGKALALVNLAGEIHALDNTCPHAGGPLGDGLLEGDRLICPWHGWGFSVTNGTCEFNAHLVQARYPVRVEDGRVLVDLDGLPGK